MRNDASLYSGSNSQSYAAQKKQARTETKLERQKSLTKDATFILEIIEKHKEGLGEMLLKQTNEGSDPAKVKEVLDAIRLHRSFVENLESQIKQVLRVEVEEQPND